MLIPLNLKWIFSNHFMKSDRNLTRFSKSHTHSFRYWTNSVFLSASDSSWSSVMNGAFGRGLIQNKVKYNKKKCHHWYRLGLFFWFWKIDKKNHLHFHHPETECHRKKAGNQNEENRCFHFEFRRNLNVWLCFHSSEIRISMNVTL